LTRVSLFDYDLPAGLIAQRPLPRRDDSRMMVVRRAEGRIEHGRFRDLAEILGPGEVLVLNDTRVIPAKVWGWRDRARVEFLFSREREPGVWDVLCRPAKRLRIGDTVRFAPGFEARVVEAGTEGRRVLRFASPDVLARLKDIGHAPLPPYIKRPKEDAGRRREDLERYQTVFARRDGAIAAPTAGLHFTPGTLAALAGRGVEVVAVTLDVGLATFQPVRVETVEEHRMHEERCAIAPEAARRITAAKKRGAPVTAVGTTVVRTLESAWQDGELRSGTRATDLFIHPGYTFRVVDRLLTNFHLPRSTLLMLVSAFGGTALVRRAYREAVREGYRFYSYGDCMLIL
jgi:S-adenosylmethionine:tRNA ribosyltransferase-isomerase